MDQHHQSQSYTANNHHHHDHHHYVDRFCHSQWFALTAFSIVALVATLSRIPDDMNLEDTPKHVKWVASGISVILVAAALSWGALFACKKSFAETLVEGGTSMFTTGMWAAIMPSIFDPDHSLMAVTSRSGGLRHPNLYFFSWAACITSYYIMMGCLSKSHAEWCKSNNREVVHDHGMRWMWSGLILTSFVVMVTSSRIHMDCDELDEVLFTKDTCDRVKYGIGVSTVSLAMALIGTVYSMLWAKVDDKNHALVQGLVVGILMILWTFGATWLTFDEEKSPAVAPGNLYFFTWGSWTLLLFMAMQCLQHTIMIMCPESTTTVEVETTGTGKVVDPEREPAQETDGATHATHDDKHAEPEESQV